MNSNTYSESSVPVNRLFWLGGIFFTVIFLSIGQDFVSSSIKGGAFFLSESALYKMNWILFLPILWVIFLCRPKFGHSFLSIPWLMVAVPILSFIHTMASSILIHLFSSLFLDHTYRIGQVLRYFFAEEFYLILLVYLIGYVVLYINRITKTEEAVIEPVPMFVIRTRNGLVRVSPETITHICSERPYIAIHTINHKYLDSSTLKKVTKQLDPSVFVRIHRSTIVNLHYVQNLKSRGNGDYDLQLFNGQSLRLSRNYASALKSQMINATHAGH